MHLPAHVRGEGAPDVEWVRVGVLRDAVCVRDAILSVQRRRAGALVDAYNGSRRPVMSDGVRRHARELERLDFALEAAHDVRAFEGPALYM